MASTGPYASHLQCSRQIATPAPHHSVFTRRMLLLHAQPPMSKHWRHCIEWLQECKIKNGKSRLPHCTQCVCAQMGAQKMRTTHKTKTEFLQLITAAEQTGTDIYLVMSKLGERRKHKSKWHVSLFQQIICTWNIVHCRSEKPWTAYTCTVSSSN